MRPRLCERREPCGGVAVCEPQLQATKNELKSVIPVWRHPASSRHPTGQPDGARRQPGGGGGGDSGGGGGGGSGGVACQGVARGLRQRAAMVLALAGGRRQSPVRGVSRWCAGVLRGRGGTGCLSASPAKGKLIRRKRLVN